MSLTKMGSKLPFTWESILAATPAEKSRGHFRKLTPEEHKEWKKAQKALKTIKTNKYISWTYDGPELIEPRKWVRDE